MTSSSLPQRVQARRLAKQGIQIEGTVELKDLERLSAQLADTSGEAEVRLQFRIDEDGNCVVETAITSRVTVLCQRCLEPMPLEISSGSNVLLIAGESQEQQDKAGYESYVIENGELVVRDLVEDELLLALPFAPTHQSGSCAAQVSAVGPNMQNPFSILAKLKQT